MTNPEPETKTIQTFKHSNIQTFKYKIRLKNKIIFEYTQKNIGTKRYTSKKRYRNKKI